MPDSIQIFNDKSRIFDHGELNKLKPVYCATTDNQKQQYRHFKP